MTPCVLSCPVDGLSWLSALAREQADVFLTPGMEGVPVSGVAGLWPEAEWRLGPDGGLEELKRFCFGSPGPALGFLAYHAAGWPGSEGPAMSGAPQAEGGSDRIVDPESKAGPEPQTPPGAEFPAGVFRKYRVLLVPSPDGRRLDIHSREPETAGRAARLLSQARGAAPQSLPPPGPVTASLDREGYRRAVRRALEHILDGDVYQLNLSIRFEAHWPGLSPSGLFARLILEHPAMFYALFDAGSHAVVSTSPERFIKVRRGRVLSQPIKGTRRLSGSPGEDLRLLLDSPKEDAELSMIVDLIRNDLSPHCEYGSVAVRGHRSVFEVDGLLQAYSNVEGRLREGSTCLDLLWDGLPPGSVTGCPKRRAVEIIGGLEPHRRDAYCGCLAVVHGPRDMDSSVAIRTAVLDRARNVFSWFAGSGIVVDSDPDSEYEETLAKASKFLALARRTTP